MLRRESDEAAASRAQGSDAPELLHHAGPLQSQKGGAIIATTPPQDSYPDCSWAPPPEPFHLWTDHQKPSSRQYAWFPPNKNEPQPRYSGSSVIVESSDSNKS